MPNSPYNLTVVDLSSPQALFSESLSPAGHPRISWNQSHAPGLTYAIARRWDRKEEMPCRSGQLDQKGWCRLNISAAELMTSSGRIHFTDTEVTADRAAAVAYQYRVAIKSAGESSSASTVWANCCDNAIDGQVAMKRWVEQLNRYPLKSSDGSLITVSLADLPPPTELPTHIEFAKREFSWLSDDKYIALFSKHGGLLALTHRSQGEEFINGERRYSAASWLIRLSTSNGSGHAILSGNQYAPDNVSFDLSTGTLLYDWYDVSGLRVRCRWRLEAIDRTGLHARISVTGTADGSHHAGMGIERVHFPYVVGLGYDYVDLYWPGYNIGVWEPDFPRWSSAPHRLLPTLTSAQTAQFIGLGHGLQMMYVAAEDGQAEPKAFRIQPHSIKNGKRNNTSATELYLYPQNGDSRPGNSIDMKYDIVLTPFCGDWPRLARRYRRFAIGQDWLHVPETAVKADGDKEKYVKARTVDRIDLPAALKDGVFWWTSNNGPKVSLERMTDYMNLKLKSFIGPEHDVPVGMHLYNWHSPAFDRNYPEFEQRYYCGTDRAQDEFCRTMMPDLVQRVQSDGTLVMPYINATMAIVTDRCYSPGPHDSGSHDSGCGTSTDAPDGRSWGWWTRPFFPESPKPEVPENIVMRKTPHHRGRGDSPGGVLSYDSWYNTGETFAKMDLIGDFWQRVIRHNVTSVYGYGALGVYLDTLGGGYQPDYAPLHGLLRDHPAGHSDYWRRGTQRIASITRGIGDMAEQEQANDQAGPRFNSAEHFNEAYIGSIDLFTVYSQQPKNTIPLIPSVYGDFQMFAGPQLRKDDSVDARSYRLARGFLWGLQLGLTSLAQVQGLRVAINDESECRDDYYAGGKTFCDFGNLAFARSLAKARLELKQYLAYGKLLELPADPDPARRKTIDHWCIDQSCTFFESPRFPNILAARWRELSGKEIIVIVNPNDTQESANLPLPYAWMGNTIKCYTTGGNLVGCGGIDSQGEYFNAVLSKKTIRYLAIP